MVKVLSLMPRKKASFLLKGVFPSHRFLCFLKLSFRLSHLRDMALLCTGSGEAQDRLVSAVASLRG